MKHVYHSFGLAALAAMFALGFSSCASTRPATYGQRSQVTAGQLAAESQAALQKLYARNEKARRLGPNAQAIIVFPEIVRAGLVLIGALGGKGALIRPDGTIPEFYETVAFSYGLQVGGQKYGYALFLMDEQAIASLHRKHGWELGSSPTAVVANKGFGRNLSTTTIGKSTHAFFFDQQGLMVGGGLQGAKINRIYPPP